MRRTLAALVATLALAATPVLAGIVDTPVPAGMKLLYSVPGVINTGSGLATFFSCTNADTQAANIGVEVFGAAGGSPLNNFLTTTLPVASDATVIFGTSGAAGIFVDQNLALGTVAKGSARILASSTKLLCTAFLADTNGLVPGSMTYLTIVAKTKQKAAN